MMGMSIKGNTKHGNCPKKENLNDGISGNGNFEQWDFQKRKFFDENFFGLGEQNCLFRKFPFLVIVSKKGNFDGLHKQSKNHFETIVPFLEILMADISNTWTHFRKEEIFNK